MTLQLFNADCLEQMKSIPDKSIDLIICDLPYGCLSGGGQEKRKGVNKSMGGGFIAPCSWDIKLDLDLFWKQVKRIRKNDHTPCLHFCSTRFGYELIKSNEKEFRYDLVWNKMRGVGFLGVNKKPMVGHEMIYVFSKKGSNYNRIDIAGEPYKIKRDKVSDTRISKHYNVVRDPHENSGTRCVISVIDNHNSSGMKNGHPTTKPPDLYKWLIERYSNEGDTVLDPTFGSCNSGRVCQELKRNYIGIEKNKEFFDKAQSLVLEPATSTPNG